MVQSAKTGTIINLFGWEHPCASRRGVSTSPCLLFFILLIAIPGIAWSQPHVPLQPRQVDNTYSVRVNVELVVLHATVRNREGTPISGLSEEDFQVYEDGVLQKIESFRHEDIPVSVGLICDSSGSMRAKRPEVVTAALAFARSSNPQDQMFVINFNENISFGLPNNIRFTDQTVLLQAALSNIKSDGMTALYDAVAAGLEHLDAGNREKKVLIVISDGADTASKKQRGEIEDMAGKSDTIIYTIGLFEKGDPDQNPGVLKKLARLTGGEAFFPRSVKDINPTLERIAHDIRTQYTIGYIPTNNEHHKAFRAVQVKAERPGRGRLFVRTRTGYSNAGPDTRTTTSDEIDR